MEDLISFLIIEMKRDKGCVIALILLANMLQLNWAFYICTHSWRNHQKLTGNTSGFICHRAEFKSL